VAGRDGTKEDELVRCIACGCVYDLPVRAPAGGGSRGCPECGGVSWVALSIPVSPRDVQGIRPTFAS
jgi:hypothetical protein